MSGPEVINFSSLRRKNNEEESQDSIQSAATPKDVMQTKIATSRMHANKEIKQFKQIVDNFCTEVDKLSLFGNIGETINSLCIEQMLEGVIEPILKGQKPIGMPEDAYRTMRADMYKTLINRYVDKIGANTEE